jgi:superfamily I DNA/RNA helicase/mRNA-degrading endonuclease RelE of RelBE toxin-antitoxin system
MSAQLRLLDKADKEILKLPRSVKGAIYEFQHKFRQDPGSPGLRLKPLKGDSRLYSARVTDEYRALLLRIVDDEYLLVAVKKRGSVYEKLDRYKYQVNPVSGGIEFIDIMHLSSFGQPVEVDLPAHTEPSNGPAPAGSPKNPESVPDRKPLFADYSREQLLELGVAEPLLPLIAKITGETSLLGLMEYAPQLTGEVLSALYDGKSVEEVLEQVTTPVKEEDPVDVDDFETAAKRPATMLVTTDDEALQAILEGNFARWRVFLHPVQRLIVDRHYNGPARVSGGPGTGKTIVALHRVKHLVGQLPAGSGKDVLFTTFNKNLATDLQARLLELGGQEMLDRVDVVNIDSLATRVAAEAEPDARRHWIYDESKAVELWQQMLLELGEPGWSAEFLHDEWSQVVLGHAINSRDEYLRVRRAGRGKHVNRAQRAEIWQLVEQFTKRLAEQGQWTFRQLAAHAARLETDRAAAKGHRYRHVVVDEAQDLTPAHWMLLRAMVAEGPDDMFIAGDTHQRIYDNYVSLGSLGIAIRGRSSRLTLSYRSTHEILIAGEAVLGNEEWDDLDSGTDTLKGYRSVLHGEKPSLRGYATWEEELDGIVAHVKEWQGQAGTVSSGKDSSEPEPSGIALSGAGPSIGVAVLTRSQVEKVEEHLTNAGIGATTIGKDGPRLQDATVHVGTLHRFKGLEYQHMLVADASAGSLPSTRIESLRATDPHRYARELKRARSLLFVAATRARDALAITWHGTPSPFLPR